MYRKLFEFSPAPMAPQEDHNNSISNSNIDVFIKLLESCDFARYTPLDKSDMIKDYENASKIISQIDKQL